MQPFVIGLIAVSDRASAGVYEDRGLPALRDWLSRALTTDWRESSCIVPDEQPLIEEALRRLCDEEDCSLVLTTGGTGPAPRDITPEATRAVAERELPGFAEQMRAAAIRHVPTAILARQIAAIRNRSLIINLPGNPKAIGENLAAVFPAVPYCLELIGAARLDTDPKVCAAFRPSASGKSRRLPA